MTNFNYSNDTRLFLAELHKSYSELRSPETIDQLYFYIRREFNKPIIHEQGITAMEAAHWIQTRAIHAYELNTETGEVESFADYEYGDSTFDCESLKASIKPCWYADIFGNTIKYAREIGSFIVTSVHNRGYFAPGMRSRVAALMNESAADATFNGLVDQISRYLNTQLKTYHPQRKVEQ